MNNLAAQDSHPTLSSRYDLSTKAPDFLGAWLNTFEPPDSLERIHPACQPLRFFEALSEANAPRDSAEAVTGAKPAKTCAAHAPELVLVAWMARIVVRDERAFSALYHDCAPRTQRAVLRIVTDRHVAEEVTADCYWQVWRDAGRFDERRGSVLAWIASIARSRAVDAIRRRAVYRKHEQSVEDAEAMPDELSCESPCTRLDRQRRLQRLRHMMSCLDPVQRQLLYLAFVTGLSHQEISSYSEMALGTVKSHIRRGLASLHLLCKGTGMEG